MRRRLTERGVFSRDDRPSTFLAALVVGEPLGGGLSQLPVAARQIIRIICTSPRSDQAGCPNVAGLFFSIRKCAGQAVPYPISGNAARYRLRPRARP